MRMLSSMLLAAACAVGFASDIEVAPADEAFVQHAVSIGLYGFPPVSLGSVGVPFGVEHGAKATKLGKLDFPVSPEFAAALSEASKTRGASTPVTVTVTETGVAEAHAVPISVSLPLCALIDNHFKFRIRLHASMPGSGIADNVDVDLPAKYTGCGADALEEGWYVTPEAVLAAAPSGEGTAFLAYVPARDGGDAEDAPSMGVPYAGQRRIAASSDGKAAVDPTTGAAQVETPPPTFWQKYGTYIMIGGAVFLFAGGGGGGEGGEGGQRRGGGNARG